jgi:hypothetical protein
MGVAMIRWITHNCQVGACSGCNWPFAACAHECHVDGASRALETPAVVPEPMVHAPNPAFEAMVHDRGLLVCIRAEPHGVDVAPCAIHASEARRGLMDAYLGQQGQVA